MKHKLFFLFTIIISLIACNNHVSSPQLKDNTLSKTSQKLDKTHDLTGFVNTFIGTDGHGHTYPGASMPFGMMQLSPDTRLEGWDGCGGYHYTDSIVYGFSHTHLSGTGVPDYGDILLMPTTRDIIWDNGYKSGVDNGYASRFSHKKESASPGYYRVYLEDYDVEVELSVSKRCGLHRYHFNNDKKINIILDLLHRDRLLDSDIEIIGNNAFSGKRISKAWATEQYVYFYAEFSKPFISSKINRTSLVELGNKDRNTQAAFTFSNQKDSDILLRIGISAVSVEGAKKNLRAEINHWDFDKIKNKANRNWNQSLSKIEIKEPDIDKKTIFYTALYHSMLNPNLFMDIDNQYRGTDLKIHKADGYTNYTLFSLWDTYRGAHPLYTILETQRTTDFINTFLHQYKEGGRLPIWELAGNYTGCMIGYHSVSVIADAYAKGIRGFDTKLALEAMAFSAKEDKLGLDALKENGYISAGREPESVSKTLEYAYDDWCIGQFAKAIGDHTAFQYFNKRGQYYKNIFDPSEGFMRAKLNNAWFVPFDPAEVNYNYTEANSWQYSFAAPQDIKGMINLYGGIDKFDKKLDQLFETNMELSGRHQVDITGLIGQYAHGNEPSHHIAYLYNYAGKPWKTQDKIHEILHTMYQNKPDGLSGNEDCGQMSAWYVLSAMGFYPVTPGLPYYTIGTPIIEEATIHLENKNTFTIHANNLSKSNKYIQSATLNDQPYHKSYLNHKDIMNGGKLVFEMGDQANKSWGKEILIPSIEEEKIVPVPFFVTDGKTFSKNMVLSIGSTDKNSKIYYTLDGRDPDLNSMLYQSPISIKSTTNIKAVAYHDGIYSFPISSQFFKINDNRTIKLLSTYANQYSAGGDNALIDYISGKDNYRTGAYQGYQGQDVEVIVDLGEIKSVNKVSIGFLQDIKSWIWFPKEVQFEAGSSKDNIVPIGVVPNDFPTDKYGGVSKQFTININQKIRYIKIKAINYGKCPDWHLGAGGESWLFADEILVE